MEMEYRDPGRRGKVIIILGFLLALLAGAAAFYLINQAQQQAGQGDLQRVAVVVATRDIPARKPVEADDVTIRQVPLDPTNERGVVTDVQQVVGRVLAVPVLQGQMVTTNMLASTASGGQFSILDPTETVTPESEAWRAVSLTVPDDRGVGGMLLPNQTVDVVVTATVNVPAGLLAEGEFYTDKSTKITYQNMIILAKAGSFYIVKATLAVAEEISHLQASGTAQFSMVLRPEQDLRYADASTLGATTNLFIERYGLPIPEVFPPGQGPLPSAEPTETPSSPPTAEPSPSASPSP
jgi:Flp pilus assembly protein CpaB